MQLCNYVTITNLIDYPTTQHPRSSSSSLVALTNSKGKGNLGGSDSGFRVAILRHVGQEGGYFGAFASLRKLLRRQSCYVLQLCVCACVPSVYSCSATVVLGCCHDNDIC
jgi:hypothetical protein